MRAIVHTVKRDGPTKKRVAYLANKKTLLGDWLGNDAALNAERLIENHHGKGRKTRHFIVSLEHGADLPDEQMGEVAERFAAAFAPGVAWLGAVDRNTKAVHLHLLLCNSDGERTLNFSPQILRKMQEVATWSGGVLETGRRGAVLAKLTTAKQLKEMTYEQIRTAIENRTLEVGRRNKEGVITSVVLGGRRVRLSTVQRVGTIGGGSENRLPDVPKMGVVCDVAARRKRCKAETRRGYGRSSGNRGMESSPSVKQEPAASPASLLRRESPSIFSSPARSLQGEGEPKGERGMDGRPSMGGRIR